MQNEKYEVLDENGQPVTGDALADLLSTADTVEFTFEKMSRGKVVKRAVITIGVDTAQIGAKDVADYRRAVASNAVEQQKVTEEAKQLGILDADGKDTNSKSPEKPRLLARLGELNEDFDRASAELLAKMVTSGPIAGKDLSKPEVLCEREGIGPAAREALYAYFLGDWSEPEEETGETETPSTENVSDSTEQAETKEVAPAIS
jgi:hypothetical protein